MTFLEKELEDFLFYFLENNDLDLITKLELRGLDFDYVENMSFSRQMDLQPYGIADIIGIGLSLKDGVLVANVFVFELKKDKISYSAFGQACRYLRCIDNQVTLKAEELGVGVKRNYEVILVGTELDVSSDFLFLPSFITDLRCFCAEFSPINGITFSETPHYVKGNNDNLPSSLKEIFNSVSINKKL